MNERLANQVHTSFLGENYLCYYRIRDWKIFFSIQVTANTVFTLDVVCV